MAITMSNTTNYSGMLYTRVDENTRFLDAIYGRGRGGGRNTTYSLEFVLASGYDMDDPSQPAISETASLTAPEPETTERDQEYNVVQIFQRTAKVSYVKQSNRDMLGGVHNANQQNNVPNELDFQVGRRVAQMRMDLNYTLINGVYQYAKGSTTVAPKTRGLLPAIQTNLIDAAGAPLTRQIINDTVKEAIANGADPTAFEIWCNPAMLDIVTDVYASIPGFTQPGARTEGGIAITQILTPYAPLTVQWEPNIPDGDLVFVNMGQMAVAEKPYFDINGNNLGVLFYVDLATTGAGEGGFIYGELGTDYGAEWHHARITGLETA